LNGKKYIYKDKKVKVAIQYTPQGHPKEKGKKKKKEQHPQQEINCRTELKETSDSTTPSPTPRAKKSPRSDQNKKETTPLLRSTCKEKNTRETQVTRTVKDEAMNPPRTTTIKPYRCQRRTGCTSHSW